MVDPDNTSSAAPESVVIEGLPGGPVTVSGSGDDLVVTKAVEEPPAAKAVEAPPAKVEESKAAAADDEAGDEEAEDASDDEAEESDDANADAEGDESGDADGEADGEADESDKSDDDKSDEEKEGDEKKEGEADEDGQEAKEPEPSEADKLADEVGGVEVLQAAAPFIKTVFDPDSTPDARVAALKEFLPAAQEHQLRTVMFWDEVSNGTATQDLLAQDPEAREIFAQKVFGVPFEFLRQIADEQLPLYTEGEVKEIVERAREAAKAEGADDAKPEQEGKKAEAKKADDKKADEKEAELPAGVRYVVEAANPVVDEVVKSFKIPEEKIPDFEREWQAAVAGDADAAALIKKVIGHVNQGATGLAEKMMPKVLAHARRLAAVACEKVTAPKAVAKQAAAPKSKKVPAKEAPKAKAPKAKAATAVADTPIARVAARFPDGRIPDPDSPEFAKFLEEDFQRRLGG